MSSQNRRVLLVGEFGEGSLERSYQAALKSLAFEVRVFDIGNSIRSYCRFGRVGQTFNSFVPVEAWVRKANRDLVTNVFEFQPDFVFTFGHYQIQPGALAQIKSSTATLLVHIWPDTLLNVDANLISCLRLFDLVATYSDSSREHLQKLGAPNVAWIPLAGDPSLHPYLECDESEKKQYGADVTFIGGWRPEREAVLQRLVLFDLRIWGPDWGRRCRGNDDLLKRWQGRALYGEEFAKAVRSSKINLNIIDPLNYPAANMRFFEIPAAGGLQVCSRCPEMDEEFMHGEQIFYYQEDEALNELIASLLEDQPLRNKVAEAAQANVLSAHTYTKRVESILKHFENGAPSA